MERTGPDVAIRLSPSRNSQLNRNDLNGEFQGTNRNDWPHRSVVARQSSARVTGSFCHSSVLKAMVCRNTEEGLGRRDEIRIGRVQ